MVARLILRSGRGLAALALAVLVAVPVAAPAQSASVVGLARQIQAHVNGIADGGGVHCSADYGRCKQFTDMMGELSREQKTLPHPWPVQCYEEMMSAWSSAQQGASADTHRLSQQSVDCYAGAQPCGDETSAPVRVRMLRRVAQAGNRPLHGSAQHDDCFGSAGYPDPKMLPEGGRNDDQPHPATFPIGARHNEPRTKPRPTGRKCRSGELTGEIPVTTGYAIVSRWTQDPPGHPPLRHVPFVATVCRESMGHEVDGYVTPTIYYRAVRGVLFQRDGQAFYRAFQLYDGKKWWPCDTTVTVPLQPAPA